MSLYYARASFLRAARPLLGFLSSQLASAEWDRMLPWCLVGVAEGPSARRAPQVRCLVGKAFALVHLE